MREPNKEEIEIVARDLCKENITDTQIFSDKTVKQFIDAHWEEYISAAKAATASLKKLGYVSIDELIERAEKEKLKFQLKAGFDRMGMAAHAETWLKEQKAEQ